MKLGSYKMPLAVLSGMAVLSIGASAQTGSSGTEAAPRLPEAVIVHRQGSVVPPPAMSVAQVPTQQYSHGDPTVEEQYMLEFINRARANPAADGERLASTTDPWILNNYKYWKVDIPKIRSDFAGYPSRPPLAFNEKLIAAARRHSNDMAQHDFQGHDGSDGSSFVDRLSDAGYTGWTKAGENVSAYSPTIFAAHAGFNVDWGNEATLGHRHNIMNYAPEDGIYTEIGIGVIHEDKPATQVGPLVVTEDFGNKTSPFLLGVVYTDKNGNGFYDMDEGISGVKITPSIGNYYAVSSTSGGYAIPMTGLSGSVTLTATVPGQGTMTKTVTLSGSNMKVDFFTTPAQTPMQVALIAPMADALIGTDTAKFVWAKSLPNVTRYRIEIADAEDMSGIFVVDSSLTDTTKIVRNLPNTPKNGMFYWRVQAMNDVGWGPYSDVRSFAVLKAPAAIVLTAPEDNATVRSTNIRFSWQAPVPDVDRYWFELATDAQMMNIIVVDSLVIDTMKVVDQLQPGATYYWRVYGVNDAGTGSLGQTRKLQVSLSGVEESAGAGAFMLSANAPNPFSGATTIGFVLARAEDVRLTVLNSLGQEIATLVSGRLPAAAHEAVWNAAGAADGVYYYRLQAGDHVETRKMILTR